MNTYKNGEIPSGKSLLTTDRGNIFVLGLKHRCASK
jgi:hypothetical protein